MSRMRSRSEIAKGLEVSFRNREADFLVWQDIARRQGWSDKDIRQARKCKNPPGCQCRACSQLNERKEER